MSASTSPLTEPSEASLAHATCPSGRINTAVGAVTAPSTGRCRCAPLDNRDVDARQGQLARQHQPRRASTGN
jgi:hypothetical protein